MPPVENPVHVSSNKRVIVSPGLNFSGMDGLPKYAVGLFDNKGPGPRKRKRLTHLTPEEKIMRRKLKNRVAAQTARDRKKARIDSLEDSVATLREQTKQLLIMNTRLLKRTEAIEQENNELRKKLGLSTCVSNIEEEKETLDELSSNFEDHIQKSDSYFQPLNCTGSSESDDDVSILNSEVDVSMVREEMTCEASRVDKSRSPVPAASGERNQERPIPQQQEAVHSLKLIHLPILQNLRQSTPSFLKLPPEENSVQICQNSSENKVKKVVLSKTLLTKPLDLRKR